MKLLIAVMVIFASSIVMTGQVQSVESPKAAFQWEFSESVDPITKTVKDSLFLKGKWNDSALGFPYQNAIPSIAVSCSQLTWGSTILFAQAILQPGTWDIDNRIDDVRGKFVSRAPVAAGNDFVQLTKADFDKLMRATTVFVRLRLFDGPPVVAEFDMSADNSKVREKCPK